MIVIDTLPAVVEKLNFLFENDTTSANYSYIEFLNDGRGFTFGKVGFTTATGDGYDLIREYTESAKDSKLAFYVDELKKLAKKNSDDTTNLVGFSEAWQKESLNTIFFQNKIAFELYGQPAINYCKLLGLKSTLALAIVYDAIVQHGDGKDDDGIRKLFKHTIKSIDGSPSGRTHKDKSCSTLDDGEKEFLKVFLDERKSILEDANNKDTKEEWEESVERVHVFQKLLQDNNFDLKMPLEITSKDWNKVIQ